MLQGSGSGTTRRARSLRKAMSLPEVLLWQRLKGKAGGFRFRRQQQAGEYVFDFYGHEARLIVEVDGIAHDMGDRPVRDGVRDSYFADKGLPIMRLPADEVLRDPDIAAECIVRACAAHRSAA